MGTEAAALFRINCKHLRASSQLQELHDTTWLALLKLLNFSKELVLSFSCTHKTWANFQGTHTLYNANAYLQIFDFQVSIFHSLCQFSWKSVVVRFDKSFLIHLKNKCRDKRRYFKGLRGSNFQRSWISYCTYSRLPDRSIDETACCPLFARTGPCYAEDTIVKCRNRMYPLKLCSRDINTSWPYHMAIPWNILPLWKLNS